MSSFTFKCNISVIYFLLACSPNGTKHKNTQKYKENEYLDFLIDIYPSFNPSPALTTIAG